MRYVWIETIVIGLLIGVAVFLLRSNLGHTPPAMQFVVALGVSLAFFGLQLTLSRRRKHEHDHPERPRMASNPHPIEPVARVVQPAQYDDHNARWTGLTPPDTLATAETVAAAKAPQEEPATSRAPDD
jgi:hypothetical protein